jgi:hypothetical protein
MEAKMGLETRKELLVHVQKRYKQAKRPEKKKILDELIATTGYRRKYAISLLNKRKNSVAKNGKEKRLSKRRYDEVIRQALW